MSCQLTPSLNLAAAQQSSAFCYLVPWEPGWLSVYQLLPPKQSVCAFKTWRRASEQKRKRNWRTQNTCSGKTLPTILYVFYHRLYFALWTGREHYNLTNISRQVE